jgi:amidase
VAVAANLCVVAIGTETDGSIIAPSSINGIVGIKPTVGLLSRSGIIPISKTQDTAGPMARTVKDAAIFLSALCGADPNDDGTTNIGIKHEPDYTSFLTKDGLQGARIGVEKSHLEGRADVTGLFRQAVEVMKSKGATIVEIDWLKQYRSKEYPEFTILQYEFKDGVNKYLSKANTGVKSLSEVITFNQKNEAKAMPFFKQETLESCNKKGSLTEKEYTDAIAKRSAIRKFFDDVMQEQKVDAICGISYGPAGVIDLVNGDYDTGYFFSPPAAVTGYPHITVPMGKVHELPVGLSFMAGALQEGMLIKIAYAFEQATKKRERPAFIQTLTPA